MSRDEKREAFLDAFYDMLRGVLWGNRAADEICYDHTQRRLWSFALQGTWEVKGNKDESRLVSLESLIAVHAGSWGIGLVLGIILELLDENLELYLLWKELEVRAVVAALQRHPNIPTVGVNLRPTEWMQERIQTLVLEATKRMPGRIAFEVTEYTNDVHFLRIFGAEGTLRERLTTTLLPVLQRMKDAGVLLLADDLKPHSVYRFEDEECRRKGLSLEETYACTSETMLSEEWVGVFEKVKFSIDWAIHALHLSCDSGADFAQVPLYKLHLKDGPAHVATATGAPAPSTPEEEAEALRRLQEAAGREFRAAFNFVQAKCRHPPVIEGTLPLSCIESWGFDHTVGEQGGVFFEAKFPPQWYFGDID